MMRWIPPVAAFHAHCRRLNEGRFQTLVLREKFALSSKNDSVFWELTLVTLKAWLLKICFFFIFIDTSRLKPEASPD